MINKMQANKTPDYIQHSEKKALRKADKEYRNIRNSKRNSWMENV